MPSTGPITQDVGRSEVSRLPTADAITVAGANRPPIGFLTSQPAAPLRSICITYEPVPGTLRLVAGPFRSAEPLTAPGGTRHVTIAAGTGEVAVEIRRNTPPPRR